VLPFSLNTVGKKRRKKEGKKTPKEIDAMITSALALFA
jgi:hypothetical protein